MSEQVDTENSVERIVREESDGTTMTTIANGGRERDGTPRTLGRWTFEYTPARELVKEHMHGRVLNACAGKTKLEYDGEIVRNDLNPDRDADTNYDVANIADYFDSGSFDTIIFDPPFDDTQADDKYDGLHAKDVYAAFRCFNELIRPSETVITFGWNSWGMKTFSAFERSDVYLLQRGPCLRDVIVTIDYRTTESITDGGWGE
ncbi:hypothetical protein [Haladaptatus cibarius]|uniref:hypothetical protein n=1 Tax=Haladaptatus cibarius TaxID=453847 RepID=UPI000A67FF89|nr:hypothetical protein [Haladaptatus cibarius]